MKRNIIYNLLVGLLLFIPGYANALTLTVLSGQSSAATSTLRQDGYVSFVENDITGVSLGTKVLMMDIGESIGITYIINPRSESEPDVATSKWIPSWQMPSSTQMDELLNECIWTWCDGDKTKYNGTSVKGYIISSKVNNNKIFLPAAGNYYKDELIYGDEFCLYWSSSQYEGSAFQGEAYYTNSNSAVGMDYNYKQTYVDLRYYGQTVRPVMNPNGKPD